MSKLSDKNKILWKYHNLTLKVQTRFNVMTKHNKSDMSDLFSTKIENIFPNASSDESVSWILLSR